MDLRSQTIFSQLMDILPRYEFTKCVERYHAARRAKVEKLLRDGTSTTLLKGGIAPHGIAVTQCPWLSFASSPDVDCTPS
jgi:hypothetical protein